jgi:tetratricopeptide (TPR) repeat protein
MIWAWQMWHICQAQACIATNDQYWQANLYSQLGFLAVEQNQFDQAEQYYEKGLRIYLDLNLYYKQAQVYCNWGILSQKQGKAVQAQDYLLRALGTFVDYHDDFSRDFVLRHLARLWQRNDGANLPSAIASIVGSTPDEVEVVLREIQVKESDATDDKSEFTL